MRILHLLISALIVLIILYSCNGKFEPDPIDPRISRYSHEGLDAASALVNDSVWRAVRENPFLFGGNLQTLRIFRDSSHVRLSIDGNIGIESSLEGNRAIGFYLGNADGRWDNIENLQGQKFSLDGKHYAFIREVDIISADASCSSTSGQLYIRDLERLEHENDVDYIMAGTFSFTINQDTCLPYNVTFGRFDYRVEGY